MITKSLSDFIGKDTRQIQNVTLTAPRHNVGDIKGIKQQVMQQVQALPLLNAPTNADGTAIGKPNMSNSVPPLQNVKTEQSTTGTALNNLAKNDVSPETDAKIPWKIKVFEWVKKNWYVPLGVLVLLITFLMFRGKKKTSKRTTKKWRRFK